jgi:3-methyladenine DNA glycosylase Tag
MTALDKRKTRLVFTTCDVVRDRGRLRSVVIDAQPYMAMVRLAGTRTSFPISWAAVYHAAARLQAQQVRAAKQAARKGASKK